MEHFIETVKQFPIIWNSDSKEYHNLTKKEVAWKRIIEEISDPDIPDVKTAKNEWKKLRDSHRESLKRMYAGNHGASPTKNTWKYADSLEFLLPFMKNRKRYKTTNVHNQNTIDHQSKLSKTENTENSEHQNYEIQFTPSQNDDSNMSLEELRRKKKKEVIKNVDTDFIHREKSKNPLNMFFDSMCESTKRLPDWMQRDVKKKMLQIVCEAEETYESLSTKSQGHTSSSVCSTPLPHNDHDLGQCFPVKTEPDKDWE